MIRKHFRPLLNRQTYKRLSHKGTPKILGKIRDFCLLLNTKVRIKA